MSSQRAVRLEELEGQFRELAERASALAGGLDRVVLSQRPKPASWSVAECLAHLNLSADPNFPLWERGLAEARLLDRNKEHPFRVDFWGRVLCWALEPPPKFRFPAPKPFHPVAAGPVDAILPDFLDRQRRVLEVLQAVRGTAVDRVKIASPFNARVHYSIWSSFCVTAAHERRHIWQAEQAALAILA
jgi:hypothetical protein